MSLDECHLRTTWMDRKRRARLQIGAAWGVGRPHGFVITELGESIDDDFALFIRRLHIMA